MAGLVLIARLAVQIQSFFNILGQNGRPVTKVYFEKMCMQNPERQYGIWQKLIRGWTTPYKFLDMINTLFVTTVAVEPTLPTQKLQAKPHNVKERRYDKGPMNQEKTAMKAKRTTK